MNDNQLYEPLDCIKYPKTEQMKKVTKLIKKEDWDAWQVWELINQAHELNDPRASYAISSWYFHGYFPVVKRKNFKKAIYFLEPALKANIPFAFYNYAISLDLGKGIERNEIEAFKYYVLAALSGCQEAIEDIGRCYYHGIGVAKDKDASSVFKEIYKNQLN